MARRPDRSIKMRDSLARRGSKHSEFAGRESSGGREDARAWASRSTGGEGSGAPGASRDSKKRGATGGAPPNGTGFGSTASRPLNLLTKISITRLLFPAISKFKSGIAGPAALVPRSSVPVFRDRERPGAAGSEGRPCLIIIPVRPVVGDSREDIRERLSGDSPVPSITSDVMRANRYK
ncbi:hypothetical protein NL676_027065 [Syzygium grande]|nr:hypothetical protein NL676_027065 [Syzygium grande]